MCADETKCEVGCSPTKTCVTACRINAIVTVDERGQMILPKEIREKAGIKAGDRLAVVSCEKDGKIECITLMRADKLTESIKKTLGPLMQDILR